MRYLKSIIALSLIVPCIGFVLYKGEFPSIVSTAINNVQSEARDSLPLDFEIDRVRDSLDLAKADVKSQSVRVAELQVAVEEMGGEIETLEGGLASDRARVRRLRAAYEATGNGARLAVYRGVRVDPEVVTGQLRTVVDVLEHKSRLLETKQRFHETRSKALQQACATLVSLQQRCDALANGIEVARMDSELLRHTREAHDLNLSSSSLADAERRLENVKHRVRVAHVHTELTSDPLAGLEQIENDDPALLQGRIAKLLGEQGTHVADGR